MVIGLSCFRVRAARRVVLGCICLVWPSTSSLPLSHAAPTAMTTGPMTYQVHDSRVPMTYQVHDPRVPMGGGSLVMGCLWDLSSEAGHQEHPWRED